MPRISLQQCLQQAATSRAHTHPYLCIGLSTAELWLTCVQVVGLDALSLAPAAAQQALQRRREEQRRSEAVWEQLMSDSVGGGGTHVVQTKCPQCSHNKAQVHTILSGGTYAQERETIQKYVCQGCNFTWRSDN